MTVRSGQTRGRIRGRRLGRKPDHAATVAPLPGGASANTSLAGTATAGPGAAEATPRRRREGGPCQDRALYACSCGFVFDALVSTSVDCPNCGSTQAW